ncbi:MAG: PTS sugar transporter subunit IIA [Spirochaetes bacterium]|nr:PTS sugar transporter subunit IIA [Spirochaetota bacterium]
MIASLTSMKQLVKNIRKSRVVLNLQATGKREAVYEMLSKASEKGLKIDPAAVTDIVLANEKTISSGLGYGVAFPHAEIEGLKEETIIFGTSPKGMLFHAIDKKPTHLVTLFLTPAGEYKDYLAHLSLLADLSHLTMYVVMILESPNEKVFRSRMIELLKKGGMRL